MKNLIQYCVGVCLSVLLLGTLAQAAEFTVTETNSVLYSTEQAVLYSDADLNSGIVLSAENFPDNMPIQVTGITNNGFFRVNLGAEYYIYSNGLRQSEETQKMAVEAEAYSRMMAMKAQFPEGMHWTNDNFYAWNAGIYSGGYGCAGFAFILSDAIFGREPRAYIHEDYNNIRVGDILRVRNDTHSVVVLEVKTDSVIVAEGNYNSSIHWGREIRKSSLPGPGNYIMSRY